MLLEEGDRIDCLKLGEAPLLGSRRLVRLLSVLDDHVVRVVGNGLADLQMEVRGRGPAGVADLAERLARRDDLAALHEHGSGRHVAVEGVDRFTRREDVPQDDVISPTGAPLVGGPQARARLVDALSILDHRNADLLPPLDLDERVGVRDDDNTRGDRADRRAAPSVRKIDTVVGPLLLLSPPL